MSSISRTFALALLSMGLTACGGGGDSPAARQETSLQYTSGDEQVLQPPRKAAGVARLISNYVIEDEQSTALEQRKVHGHGGGSQYPTLVIPKRWEALPAAP